LAVKTFIIREARFQCRQPFEAAGKPWGLYVTKAGRSLHEVGHFETRDQAVSFAKVLADGRLDIRVE